MEWWHATILGLVQGLTEFLPISSSAHLRITSELIGIGDVGAAFTAITQIGTETAVILIYRRKIAAILRAWFGALPFGPWKNTVSRDDPDARLGWYVIFGSIPIVVLGLLLETAIDSVFRNLLVVAAMLAIFGLILGAADMTARQEKNLEAMTLRDAILFGFAQSLALIPGVSRSGGTITAGLLMGYTRRAAADYSFLLAIPAVLGSGFYKLFTDGLTGESPVPMSHTLLATVVAFVVAYAVILWFLRLITTRSYAPFVVYRVLLAIAIVVLVSVGALTAAPTVGV
ncbi:MAG TPA: undecaprenyl-diphosphatase UppP [Actinomycetaceae bacterium]|nr:undecaprenyl-diphosphatase UppP [Actinomycetaceae bacterium]